MHYLKKVFINFLLFITLTVSLAYVFEVDYLLKAVKTIYLAGHKTAFLEDYREFDNRLVSKSTIVQQWKISKKYNIVKPTQKLEAIHKQLGTVAFLIIKEDSIWSENYYEGFDKSSKSNSFSMAKSFVSAALGKAIMQRKIKSLDQHVSDFFPEFSAGLASKLTVGDLSSMASGLNWDESYYNPFSITTKAYFDDDLNKLILGLKVIEQPGKSYKYLSGNTQLLAMVIEKATKKNISKYIEDNFWQPLGAENDALWQTDKKNGTEKAYCCFAGNARDFARLGKLYKQNGRWNGVSVLDSNFVATSTKARFKASPEYGYGWWLHNYKSNKIFYMRGHLGQYVIIIPKDNLIIVRLGNKTTINKKGTAHGEDFFTYIDETYKMIKNDR